MLDTVRPPLTFGHLSENSGSLVQQLVDDTILGGFLQVFEGMLGGGQSTLVRMQPHCPHLDDQRTGLVAGQRGPLSFQRPIHADIVAVSTGIG